MDRFDAMSVLMAVTEAGSLSGGGRALGVPLSTISRKITDLERHLGARLLLRSSRKITLTEAGQAYAAAARRILAEVIAAERAAAGEYSAARGDLVITAPVVFGRMHMLPVVLDFLCAYPEIDIRLVLSDRVAHLMDDHFDLALRIGTLPDSGLMAKRLGEVHRITCASPGYLTEHGQPLQPADLAGHACITFTAFGEADRWRYVKAGAEHAVAVHARLMVNTAEVALDAAMAGFGVTRVLSYQAQTALVTGKLIEILKDFASGPVPISLVYDGQGMMPLKLRAFLDFAALRIRAILKYQTSD
ncbi:MAG: LysR family transcriptional regulator [Paracoccaceae bacterium]